MSVLQKVKGRNLVLVGGAVVVLVALWLILGGPNRATKLVEELPERRLTVETSSGDTVQFTVKDASSDEARSTGFNGVAREVVEANVLFIETAYSASSPVELKNLKAAIEIAFFDENGQFLESFDVRASSSRDVSPNGRYMYVLLARDGFLAEKGISEGSSIVLN